VSQLSTSSNSSPAQHARTHTHSNSVSREGWGLIPSPKFNLQILFQSSVHTKILSWVCPFPVNLIFYRKTLKIAHYFGISFQLLDANFGSLDTAGGLCPRPTGRQLQNYWIWPSEQTNVKIRHMTFSTTLASRHCLFNFLIHSKCLTYKLRWVRFTCIALHLRIQWRCRLFSLCGGRPSPHTRTLTCATILPHVALVCYSNGLHV